MAKKPRKNDADQYLNKLENFFKSPKKAGNSKHLKPIQGDKPAPEQFKDNSNNRPKQERPVHQNTGTPQAEINKMVSDAVNSGSEVPTQEYENLEKPLPAFKEGSIVTWGEGAVGVFKESKIEKGYDLVFVLSSNGLFQPKGIVLSAYSAREIGFIPVDLFRNFAENGTWKRDLIVFHIADFKDCDLVPEIDQEEKPVQQKPEPPQKPIQQIKDPETQKELALEHPQRGMKFEIKFGDRKWDAVYWGSDVQGSVIVHKTNGPWTLMHLDLKRFKDTMIFKGILKKEELKEIEDALLEDSQTSY